VVEQRACHFRRWLLPEATDAMDGPDAVRRHACSGLDPAVMGVRLGRPRTDEDHLVPMRPRMSHRELDMTQERAIIEYELMRGTHHDSGSSVSGTNPVRGE